MKKETKKEVKKDVASGASTAAGAAMGMAAGAALTPQQAAAAEVAQPEPEPAPEPAPQPAPQPVQPAPAPEPVAPTPPPTPEPDAPLPPEEPDEVVVVGYDRVTMENGSQMDMAVVNAHGHEIAFIDANLDGEADLLACDINQNGVIEDDEVEVVHGQGIAMQPLADAAGFDPLFAQNDLPDYVNDADVDTYMA